MNLNISVKRVFFLVTALFCGNSLAETINFDGQKFIEIASVRTISELETAKIALYKSSSPQVQAYAEHMMVESSDVLEKLRVLAHESHFYMFTDAELQTKARKYIFERKGKTFDVAYANMRAAERRKMVSLYREAINSDQVLFKQYAQAALPSLMHSLYAAQQLTEILNTNQTLIANTL